MEIKIERDCGAVVFNLQFWDSGYDCHTELTFEMNADRALALAKKIKKEAKKVQEDRAKDWGNVE